MFKTQLVTLFASAYAITLKLDASAEATWSMSGYEPGMPLSALCTRDNTNRGRTMRECEIAYNQAVKDHEQSQECVQGTYELEDGSTGTLCI